MVLTADALKAKPGCFHCAAALPTCVILLCKNLNYFTKRPNTRDTKTKKIQDKRFVEVLQRIAVEEIEERVGILGIG